MSEQWYYSRGNSPAGPVAAAELDRLVSNGQLAPTDLVWKEGMANWLPAGKIQGLSSRPITKTPPALPPISPPIHSNPQPNLVAGFHRQRLSIVMAAVTGMIASFFLPWIHNPGEIHGVRFFLGADEGGVFTMILFIPALVLGLRGVRERAIVGRSRLVAIIPALIATVIGLIKFDHLRSESAEQMRNNAGVLFPQASLQIGIGLYITIAAGVTLIVSAWLLDNYSTKNAG